MEENKFYMTDRLAFVYLTLLHTGCLPTLLLGAILKMFHHIFRIFSSSEINISCETLTISDAYSELSQTSDMELLGKAFNG